jgi:hypothetical protein
MMKRLLLVLALGWTAGAGQVGAEEAPSDTPAAVVSDAELEACRNWYRKLGFGPLAGMPWVRVATGDTRRPDGQGERNSYFMGFLAAESTGEAGKDFEILTVDRNRLKFTRTPPEEREARRVGFEKRDFGMWIKEYLAATPEDPDGIANLSATNPFLNDHPTTPAVAMCHLAMLCDETGFPAEARQLMARLAPAWTVEEGEGKPLAERLEHEFGHVLIWQAVLACDDPKNPRPDLLKGFERVVKLTPKSRHVERAAAMVELLKRMIAEDEARAAARRALPFESLSGEERIKDLIYQLRDQDGGQFMQPGSCSIFNFGQEQDSPADRLVEIGFAAVPFLIEAMGDERLTYGVGFHRDFYFSHEVMRVGEAAQEVFEKISGVQLANQPVVRVFGEDPATFSEDDGRKSLQEAARRWWREFEAKGERRFLIEEVSSGGESVRSLAAALMAKYPADAPAALKAGLKRAKDEWSHSRLVSAVGNADFEGSEAVLRQVIRDNRFGEGTLAALEALRERKVADALDLAIALLDEEKSWKEGGTMDEMPAEDLIEFLLESREEKAARAVLERLEKLSLDLRVDVVLVSHRVLDGEERPGEATLEVIEEILVRLLEDPSRRSGISGGLGELSFSDPRVCDLAAETLRGGWGDRYAFDFAGPLKVRDRQCLAAANVWRSANGKELLEIPEREVKPLTAEEFALLCERFETMASAEEEAAFVAAVMKAGVAALPRLLELEAESAGRKKEQAGEAARLLSNRVGRITIVPEGADYAPVGKWRDAMLGKPLDGSTVVALMSTFFKQADRNGEKVRGIEFEASRAADLSGVEIRIRLIPRERPGDPLDQWDGSEDVTLGDEQVHTAGYGGGLSKDDPEDSKELAAGVDKVVAADPRTPYEIRWELIGWWHDDE